MQPLPIYKRRIYLYSLILVFVLAVPLLIMYALGYRVNEQFGLVPTGGLYIATDVSGAEIYIDGTPMRETGTFRKAFFIQDLKPGDIEVRVLREGYNTWQKHLSIGAHVVTESSAFMLPIQPVLRQVPLLLYEKKAGAATTTIENPEYGTLRSLFGVASSSAKTTGIAVAFDTRATTSSLSLLSALAEATTTISQRGVVLYESDGGVVAGWSQALSEAPYFFCAEICRDAVPIEANGSQIRHFDFLPGHDGVVLLSRNDGVFATEVDVRGGQNTQALYPIPGSDFRIGLRGEIYVRDGIRFFEVIL